MKRKNTKVLQSRACLKPKCKRKEIFTSEFAVFVRKEYMYTVIKGPTVLSCVESDMSMSRSYDWLWLTRFAAVVPFYSLQVTLFLDSYCFVVFSTDRSGRGPASLSASRSPSSKVSDKKRSPQRTESISESIKISESRGHERSASESSVPEDISVSADDKSRVRSEKSRESSIPEIDVKTRSQGSSIPEEIPEEYVNDTFESLDSTATPAHSTPVRSDLSLKRDTSAISRRSSTGEGSKSEEETSMTGELLPEKRKNSSRYLF